MTTADSDQPAPETPAPSSRGIVLRQLTIQAGQRPLLDRVDAAFLPGRITLIVGPSGAGKSVLLRLLTGLIRPGDRDFTISGTVTMDVAGSAGDAEGGDASSPARKAPTVGIVFQNYALFDELSAAGNIIFGWDHRSGHGNGAAPVEKGPEVARRLLEELDIPTNVPVDLLSGGQKQRLAIARTLAFDPDVMVFDEPTSGLDPANATRVARRLRNLQEQFGKTTVIVTHDYQNLADIADHIFLLDTGKRTLRTVSKEVLDGEIREPAESIETAVEAETDVAVEASPPPAPLVKRLSGKCVNAIGDFFAKSTGALEAALACVLLAVPLWRSLRWGLRYLFHYLMLIASPSAFAYFGAAGLIAGFVSTHFTFKFLPYKAYTEQLLTEELLHGLGFALYRIIVPVLLTVLVAARCGAAVSADIGSRVYNRQIEAMRSLRAPPGPYLLTNILYAFLLATPVLMLFGFGVARLTSLLVFSYNYPEHGPLFWDGHFHRNLREPGQLFYLGTGWMLLKILLCGLGVGAIAYHIGLRQKRSGVEVSQGITLTIIWATLFVLMVHYAFAFIEF